MYSSRFNVQFWINMEYLSVICFILIFICGHLSSAKAESEYNQHDQFKENFDERLTNPVKRQLLYQRNSGHAFDDLSFIDQDLSQYSNSFWQKYVNILPTNFYEQLPPDVYQQTFDPYDINSLLQSQGENLAPIVIKPKVTENTFTEFNKCSLDDVLRIADSFPYSDLVNDQLVNSSPSICENEQKESEYDKNLLKSVLKIVDYVQKQDSSAVKQSKSKGKKKGKSKVVIKDDCEEKILNDLYTSLPMKTEINLNKNCDNSFDEGIEIPEKPCLSILPECDIPSEIPNTPKTQTDPLCEILNEVTDNCLPEPMVEIPVSEGSGCEEPIKPQKEPEKQITPPSNAPKVLIEKLVYVNGRASSPPSKDAGSQPQLELATGKLYNSLAKILDYIEEQKRKCEQNPAGCSRGGSAGSRNNGGGGGGSGGLLGEVVNTVDDTLENVQDILGSLVGSGGGRSPGGQTGGKCSKGAGGSESAGGNGGLLGEVVETLDDTLDNVQDILGSLVGSGGSGTTGGGSNGSAGGGAGGTGGLLGEVVDTVDDAVENVQGILGSLVGSGGSGTAGGQGGTQCAKGAGSNGSGGGENGGLLGEVVGTVDGVLENVQDILGSLVGSGGSGSPGGQGGTKCAKGAGSNGNAGGVAGGTGGVLGEVVNTVDDAVENVQGILGSLVGSGGSGSGGGEGAANCAKGGGSNGSGGGVVGGNGGLLGEVVNTVDDALENVQDILGSLVGSGGSGSSGGQGGAKCAKGAGSNGSGGGDTGGNGGLLGEVVGTVDGAVENVQGILGSLVGSGGSGTGGGEGAANCAKGGGSNGSGGGVVGGNGGLLGEVVNTVDDALENVQAILGSLVGSGGSESSGGQGGEKCAKGAGGNGSGGGDTGGNGGLLGEVVNTVDDAVENVQGILGSLVGSGGSGSGGGEGATNCAKVAGSNGSGGGVVGGNGGLLGEVVNTVDDALENVQDILGSLVGSGGSGSSGGQGGTKCAKGAGGNGSAGGGAGGTGGLLGEVVDTVDDAVENVQGILGSLVGSGGGGSSGTSADKKCAEGAGNSGSAGGVLGGNGGLLVEVVNTVDDALENVQDILGSLVGSEGSGSPGGKPDEKGACSDGDAAGVLGGNGGLLGEIVETVDDALENVQDILGSLVGSGGGESGNTGGVVGDTDGVLGEVVKTVDDALEGVQGILGELVGSRDDDAEGGDKGGGNNGNTGGVPGVTGGLVGEIVKTVDDALEGVQDILGELVGSTDTENPSAPPESDTTDGAGGVVGDPGGQTGGEGGLIGGVGGVVGGAGGLAGGAGGLSGGVGGAGVIAGGLTGGAGGLTGGVGGAGVIAGGLTGGAGGLTGGVGGAGVIAGGLTGGAGGLTGGVGGAGVIAGGLTGGAGGLTGGVGGAGVIAGGLTGGAGGLTGGVGGAGVIAGGLTGGAGGLTGGLGGLAGGGGGLAGVGGGVDNLVGSASSPVLIFARPVTAYIPFHFHQLQDDMMASGSSIESTVAEPPPFGMEKAEGRVPEELPGPSMLPSGTSAMHDFEAPDSLSSIDDMQDPPDDLKGSDALEVLTDLSEDGPVEEINDSTELWCHGDKTENLPTEDAEIPTDPAEAPIAEDVDCTQEVEESVVADDPETFDDSPHGHEIAGDRPVHTTEVLEDIQDHKTVDDSHYQTPAPEIPQRGEIANKHSILGAESPASLPNPEIPAYPYWFMHESLEHSHNHKTHDIWTSETPKEDKVPEAPFDDHIAEPAPVENFQNDNISDESETREIALDPFIPTHEAGDMASPKIPVNSNFPPADVTKDCPMLETPIDTDMPSHEFPAVAPIEAAAPIEQILEDHLMEGFIPADPIKPPPGSSAVLPPDTLDGEMVNPKIIEEQIPPFEEGPADELTPAESRLYSKKLPYSWVHYKQSKQESQECIKKYLKTFSKEPKFLEGQKSAPTQSDESAECFDSEDDIKDSGSSEENDSCCASVDENEPIETSKKKLPIEVAKAAVSTAPTTSQLKTPFPDPPTIVDHAKSIQLKNPVHSTLIPAVQAVGAESTPLTSSGDPTNLDLDAESSSLTRPYLAQTFPGYVFDNHVPVSVVAPPCNVAPAYDIPPCIESAPTIQAPVMLNDPICPIKSQRKIGHQSIDNHKIIEPKCPTQHFSECGQEFGDITEIFEDMINEEINAALKDEPCHGPSEIVHSPVISDRAHGSSVAIPGGSVINGPNSEGRVFGPAVSQDDMIREILKNEDQQYQRSKAALFKDMGSSPLINSHVSHYLPNEQIVKPSALKLSPQSVPNYRSDYQVEKVLINDRNDDHGIFFRGPQSGANFNDNHSKLESVTSECQLVEPIKHHRNHVFEEQSYIPCTISSGQPKSVYTSHTERKQGNNYVVDQRYKSGILHPIELIASSPSEISNKYSEPTAMNHEQVPGHIEQAPQSVVSQLSVAKDQDTCEQFDNVGHYKEPSHQPVVLQPTNRPALVTSTYGGNVVEPQYNEHPHVPDAFVYGQEGKAVHENQPIVLEQHPYSKDGEIVQYDQHENQQIVLAPPSYVQVDDQHDHQQPVLAPAYNQGGEAVPYDQHEKQPIVLAPPSYDQVGEVVEYNHHVDQQVILPPTSHSQPGEAIHYVQHKHHPIAVAPPSYDRGSEIIQYDQHKNPPIVLSPHSNNHGGALVQYDQHDRQQPIVMAPPPYSQGDVAVPYDQREDHQVVFPSGSHVQPGEAVQYVQHEDQPIILAPHPYSQGSKTVEYDQHEDHPIVLGPHANTVHHNHPAQIDPMYAAGSEISETIVSKGDPKTDTKPPLPFLALPNQKPINPEAEVKLPAKALWEAFMAGFSHRHFLSNIGKKNAGEDKPIKSTPTATTSQQSRAETKMDLPKIETNELKRDRRDLPVFIERSSSSNVVPSHVVFRRDTEDDKIIYYETAKDSDDAVGEIDCSDETSAQEETDASGVEDPTEIPSTDVQCTKYIKYYGCRDCSSETETETVNVEPMLERAGDGAIVEPEQVKPTVIAEWVENSQECNKYYEEKYKSFIENPPDFVKPVEE